MTPARIFVVDDEPAVVQLARAALVREGYEIIFATSALEALKAASDGLQIDLILSDVVMPEMSGPELIQKVRQHSPTTAAVLMSGYLVDDLPFDIPLIQKPFSPAQLVALVNQVLQSSEQDGGRPGQTPIAGPE